MVLIYNCCKNVFLTIVLLIIYSIFVPGISPHRARRRIRCEFAVKRDWRI